jgi:hypothetical protein
MFQSEVAEGYFAEGHLLWQQRKRTGGVHLINSDELATPERFR